MSIFTVYRLLLIHIKIRFGLLGNILCLTHSSSSTLAQHIHSLSTLFIRYQSINRNEIIGNSAGLLELNCISLLPSSNDADKVSRNPSVPCEARKQLWRSSQWCQCCAIHQTNTRIKLPNSLVPLHVLTVRLTGRSCCWLVSSTPYGNSSTRDGGAPEKLKGYQISEADSGFN